LIVFVVTFVKYKIKALIQLWSSQSGN